MLLLFSFNHWIPEYDFTWYMIYICVYILHFVWAFIDFWAGVGWQWHEDSLHVVVSRFTHGDNRRFTGAILDFIYFLFTHLVRNIHEKYFFNFVVWITVWNVVLFENYLELYWRNRVNVSFLLVCIFFALLDMRISRMLFEGTCQIRKT